ncbi:hypothetical protein V5P93_000952 [Actinokineospora auranticolor]|uniref:Uncharacterized protein n=1 Tax=Actinokineospora auranticolor TaxID=155976 RepID=A0A2S6GYC7_9PSEU|nr:hypothetical protein [Actinokineospora auranticolor]PPK70170.1 hypothetical protein CLV40_10280 [Actinokineospora auranticolor]
MRRDRFVEHLRDLLAASGHPGIAEVGSYTINSGLQDIEIKCTDNRVIRLNITRTSPPGGDNFSEPERIVTKS